jgi:hypothetical protein
MVPGSLVVQGNNPWLDVKYATGTTPAKGDLQIVTNGGMTAASTALSAGGPFASTDCKTMSGTACTGTVDKSVSVAMYALARPALPAANLAVVTGGQIPMNAIVFYKLTEILSGTGEGQPSIEGYLKANANGMQLTIMPPTVIGVAGAWNVYAAESDITFALNTSGTCSSLAQTTGLCRISTTVVQAITSAANNVYVGQEFAVTGAGTQYNGIFVVASVLNNTTFTYLQAGTQYAAGAITGTINPLLVSGSEVLQSGGGSSTNGCGATVSIAALSTGQNTACNISSSWTSSTTAPLKTGTVRPPGFVTSSTLAAGTCPAAGICQNTSTVTVTTGSPHGLVLNQQFMMSGATNTNTPVNVNGIFTVTGYTSPTIFSYTLTGSPTGSGDGGGGFVQPSPVLLSKIVNYTSSTSVTLADAAPVTVTGAQVAWATDDTAVIQGVIDNTNCPASTDGCTVLLPNGHYWVQHVAGQTYSLVLTQGNHVFYRFTGTGNANDKDIGGWNIHANLSDATSELVSADPFSPIFSIGTNAANSMNAGPRFDLLGFRDVSGVCSSPGGLLFQNVARSRLEDVSFREFCNGYAVRFDGLGSGANQFNYIENMTATDVQNGVVFTGGKNYDNWVEFGTFYHSQTGGGACVDFQGNQGGNSGGTNFVMSGSCNFFPIAIHLADQHSDFISTKAENTSAMGANAVGGPSGAGAFAANSGVGIQIDGSANSSSPCFQNRMISPVLGTFDSPITIGASCNNNMVVGGSYAPPTATVTDNGTGDILWDQNGLHFSYGGHMHTSTPDVGGKGTTSSGSSGTSPVSFNVPYTNNPPFCVATALSTSATVWITVLSASGFTVNTTPGGTKFNYLCIGNIQ